MKTTQSVMYCNDRHPSQQPDFKVIPTHSKHISSRARTLTTSRFSWDLTRRDVFFTRSYAFIPAASVHANRAGHSSEPSKQTVVFDRRSSRQETIALFSTETTTRTPTRTSSPFKQRNVVQLWYASFILKKSQRTFYSLSRYISALSSFITFFSSTD